jgi:cell division septal protein FtsQ
MINRRKTVDRAEFFKKKEIITNTERAQRPKFFSRFSINLRPLKTILYIGLICYGLYMALASDFFKINEVRVEGIKSVEISDYIKRSFYSKNILVLRVGSILKDITRQYPVIDEISIVRGLPRSIEVHASERNEALIWCVDKCYKIDPDGNVYEETEKPTDKLFLKDNSTIAPVIGSKVASSEFIEFYIRSAQALEGLGLKVTKAEISETTFRLDLQTSEGWRAIFDTSKSLDNQVFALQQVLDKNRADIKEYVNLGVEGLAYIK